MKNYSRAIDTFLFRKSWGEIFKALPDEKAGQLIKAISIHINGEDAALEDATLNSVLKALTKEIDLSAYKYLKRIGYLDEYDKANG